MFKSFIIQRTEQALDISSLIKTLWRFGLGCCAAIASLPLSVSARPAPVGYEAAVAARLAGEPRQAIELLEPIVAGEPDNVDARLQLGLALLALQRFDEAERAFRDVLALAPGYTDASLGLARIAQRRGDLVAAQRILAVLDPSSAEVIALSRQLRTVADRKWRIDADGSFSDTGGGRADWYDGALQLRYRASERTTYQSRIEAARRFGLTDIYGEVGVERRPSDRAAIYVVAGGAPDADFRPRWLLGAGGSLKITEGGSATVLTLAAQQASYRFDDVQTLNPGIEQYFAGGRLWVTARYINLLDENGDYRAGYLVRGDGLATAKLHLYAGYSDAPDTSEGVVIDTRSVFAGLSFDANERTTFRLSLAHEDRDPGVRQWRIATGVGWAF